jgi:hypothetical protein
MEQVQKSTHKAEAEAVEQTSAKRSPEQQRIIDASEDLEAEIDELLEITDTQTWQAWFTLECGCL